MAPLHHNHRGRHKKLTPTFSRKSVPTCQLFSVFRALCTLMAHEQVCDRKKGKKIKEGILKGKGKKNSCRVCARTLSRRSVGKSLSIDPVISQESVNLSFHLSL